MGKHAAATLELFPMQATIVYGGDVEVFGIYNRAQWEEFISYEKSTWADRWDKCYAMVVVEKLADYANLTASALAMGITDSFGNDVLYELRPLTGTQ